MMARAPRNRLQIGTLLNAIDAEGYTAAFCGGRRDEEGARAKERVYSHWDEFGQWDPKIQRTELRNLYNGRIGNDEYMHVLPLSNWTELVVWDYIWWEAIDMPSIYYGHRSRVFEHVYIGSIREMRGVRLPVRYVVRHKSDEFHDFRGYAGQAADGVMKPGDEVMVQPRAMTTTVAAIDSFDRKLEEAYLPMSVTVRLPDDVDVNRGDMVARVNNEPEKTQDNDARICWISAAALKQRIKLPVKHTARTVSALIKEIDHRRDVNRLRRDQEAEDIGLNELGGVTLRVQQPLMVDPYVMSRGSGSSNLIDQASDVTVTAGMIRG